MRLTQRLLLVGVLVVGASLGCADVVSAHAALESSTPASGSTVAESPAELVFVFNEAVELDLGGVTLTASDGDEVEIGEAHLRVGTDDVVLAEVPPLAEGQYVAGYHVVSADGHPVAGNIVFRVGSGAVDPTSVSDAGGDATLELVYGAARFAVYPAMVGSVGLWLFALLIWAPLWRSARRVVQVSLAVCCGGALLQFLLAGSYLSGGALGDAFSSSRWADVAGTVVGGWLLTRVVVSVLLLLAVVLLPRATSVRKATSAGVLGLLFGVLVATVVGDGHGGAGRWLAFGAVGTWVHIVAMALWLAGLATLLWGVRVQQPGLLGAVTNRWSIVAAACVAMIVLTGVAQAWRLLPDLDALGTRYGRLLIVKTALVVGMLVLGNRGRVLLRRRRTASSDDWPSALRMGVLVEIVLAMAVLVITTVLVQTNPSGASGAAAPASTTPATASWSAEVVEGPRTTTITLDKNAVGRRHMTVTVDDEALPLGEPVTLTARLTLEAEGLGPIPVLFTGTGRLQWESDGVEIPAAGVWRFEAFVDDPTTKVRFSTPIDITDTGASP